MQLTVEPRHLLSFSRGDELARRVASFLAPSLEIEQGALVLATGAHRDGIARELRARGVDVARETDAGRLVMVDAHTALEELLLDDEPDGHRFDTLIGARARSMVRSFGAARAYGELVDLLVRRGRADRALALERLWGELLAHNTLGLLCGYGFDGFLEPLDVDAFRAVCAAHDDVIVEGCASLLAHGTVPAQAMAEIELRTRALARETDVRRSLELAQQDLVRARELAVSQAEQAARHVVVLQTLTSALTGAATLADVARVVTTTIAAGLGASRAILAVPSADPGRLEVLGCCGTSPSDAVQPGSMAVDDPVPLATTFRTGERILLPSPESIAAELPDTAPTSSVRAAAWVPLGLGARKLGALEFGFADPRSFDAPTRELLDDLARHVALALDRALLYDAAERSRDHLAVLAGASARFSEAKLDLHGIARALADQVTRHVARSAVVLLRAKDDPCRLELAAVAHARQDVEPSVRAGLAPVIPLGAGPLQQVIEAGESVTTRFSDLGLDNLAGALPRVLAAESARGASAVAVPLRASGAVLGALVAMRDASEPLLGGVDRVLLRELADRAALSIDCAMTYRIAEAANRAKDDFLAVLGHELRNPLSPIVTALELMKLRGNAGAVERERHMIERQVRSMVRLVDDLLDVSRITRGKITLSRRDVEISSVIARAIEMASPLLESRRHHLEVDVSPTGLRVDVDEGRMAQVLANLLINAAKYTDEGGRIRIDAQADGSVVAVRVHDDGIGIAPEVLPRLFDAFVQGERRSDQARGGLGIGLTIAKSLVELHGGSISAASDGPGRGSVFCVRVPARVQTAVSLRRPGERDCELRLAAGYRRILVVDDNRDAADMLAEALRGLGHAVEVAYDGPTALVAALRFRPDTAILDIGLPAMDGYELAGRLRTNVDLALRRVVALTGYGQESDRVRAQAAGFDAHLVKPVELASILSELDIGV